MSCETIIDSFYVRKLTCDGCGKTKEVQLHTKNRMERWHHGSRLEEDERRLVKEGTIEPEGWSIQRGISIKDGGQGWRDFDLLLDVCSEKCLAQAMTNCILRDLPR